MIVTTEIALKDFPFWGQAARNVAFLTEKELNDIDMWINIVYDTPIDETFVNDLFAYSFDEVCEGLGLNVEDVYARSAD